MVWTQLSALPSGALRSEIDRVGAVDSSLDVLAVAVDAGTLLVRFQQAPGLAVVDGERPEVVDRDWRWERDRKTP